MTKQNLPQGKPTDPDSSKWLIHFKGMEKDDIRLGFLNNLEYNLSKDNFPLRHTKIPQPLLHGPRAADRTLDHDPSAVSYAKRQAGILFINGIPHGKASLQQYHEPGPARWPATGNEGTGHEYGGHRSTRNAMPGWATGAWAGWRRVIWIPWQRLKLPAVGYGIRYEFGIFNQKIINGNQVEFPEQWLEFTQPLAHRTPGIQGINQILRQNRIPYRTARKTQVSWVDTDEVIAIPYDVPVPGFGNNTVNTLRLWGARAAHEFNFQYFNSGDYIGACQDKLTSENISKVLYPNDNNHSGKELRLKQQHFFTSASLQDIIRRYLCRTTAISVFPRQGRNSVKRYPSGHSHRGAHAAACRRTRLGWDEAWDIVTQDLCLYQPYAHARSARKMAGQPHENAPAAPHGNYLRNQQPISASGFV